MERRNTVGVSLPRIPSSVLAGIKNQVRRTHSDSVVRSAELGRKPRMVFSSRNIRTSFSKGDNLSGRRTVTKTFSDRPISMSSANTSVSNSHTVSPDASFSSVSLREFESQTLTSDPTLQPTDPPPLPNEDDTDMTSDVIPEINENGFDSENRSSTKSVSTHTITETDSLTTKIHMTESSYPVADTDMDTSEYEPREFENMTTSLPTPPPSPPPTGHDDTDEVMSYFLNTVSKGYDSPTTLSLKSTSHTLTTPPQPTPDNDNDDDDAEVTSYDLKSTTDILDSLSSFPVATDDISDTSTSPPPASDADVPFQSTPPSPPPLLPSSSPPDFTPPPSPEPPLRTSSRNETVENQTLSLHVKRPHSPTLEDFSNGMAGGSSPPVKKLTAVYPQTSRQLAQPPSPPPPPPPPYIPPPPPTPPAPPRPPTIIVSGRPMGGSLTESDASSEYKSEDETLRYFNKTVIGETTISSDNSSHVDELHALSLPKNDYFASNSIDTPEQSKGHNSSSHDSVVTSPSSGLKVIKWNDPLKTTRSAIKPGTVDELKQIYSKLGDGEFKPSAIKKRRKELFKMTKTQQMKRYKKVIDMFSADETDDAPLSPTHTTTPLKRVDVVEMSANAVVGTDLKVDSPAKVSVTAKTSLEPAPVNNDATSTVGSDRWENSENDDSNPYSRANIIAFLNRRLKTMHDNQKKAFEATKKKEETKTYTNKSEDGNLSLPKEDEPVIESTTFTSTEEQRNSYSEPSGDEEVIDSRREARPDERLDGESSRKSISHGHVTESGSQRGELAVSSASDTPIGFDSKQAEEVSEEQPPGRVDADLKAGDSKPTKKDTGFRSLFFDDYPESDSEVETVNNETSQVGTNMNVRSIHASELNSQANTPMLSNGFMNTSSGYSSNMSAAMGEMQSFDIHSRASGHSRASEHSRVSEHSRASGHSHASGLSRVSGHSRSTSGASGPRVNTEETSSGVYVVQDNVGDLYVVEDVSDKPRQTATFDQSGMVFTSGDVDTSHTFDTGQSSLRSYDFNTPESTRISVDSSDLNYGKAKEVLSNLFDSLNTADRGLAVTDFQNDSVERGDVTVSGISVISDQDVDSMASQANNHTAVALRSADTDMALHEDVYKKTVLNIVTDEQDRPLWTEQTTDTQVKAWMENGDEVQVGGDTGYRTITLASNGNQALALMTPAPDYPATDTRQISTYNVSLANNHGGAVAAASVEPVIQDVATGVTVTTTKSTVIGQKVDMMIDVPQERDIRSEWNQNNRTVNSFRNSSMNSNDSIHFTNGYNSDSSQSSDARRGTKSYSVRQIKSSSLDRADSSASRGRTRYITRIDSIPKGSRPNIEKTYFTSSDAVTSRTNNVSFGDADSQYGSQTSKSTSAEASPPGESPRYRMIRSPIRTQTSPERRTIYEYVEDQPTRPDFYQHKAFNYEESVNKDGDLWRVRHTPSTKVYNEPVFNSRDSRSDRSSERYKVITTIPAEELFNTDRTQDGFYRTRDSFGSGSEQKRYKSVTKLEVTNDRLSPVRKRRHGPRNLSDSEDDEHTNTGAKYRVSNIRNEDALTRRQMDHTPEIDDSQQVYRVTSVTPSDKSMKAQRRVTNRSLFGSSSTDPLFDDVNATQPEHNYRVARTSSSEDLIVSRKISTRSQQRDSRYRRVASPTRFDSGYFDDSLTRRESPSHTTVIRVDPGPRRGRSVDASTRNSVYTVMNVKSEDNLTNGSMWDSRASPTRGRRGSYSSDSDEERRGKYRITSPKYRRSSIEREYPSSPVQGRRSRRDEQTKYYVQRTLSPSRVEDSEPVMLSKRVRSISPQPYYSRVLSQPQWHKSSVDINRRNYSTDYTTNQRSSSFASLSPEKESRSYVAFSDKDDYRPVGRSNSQNFKTEKTFFLRSTSPSPPKTNRNISRSFSHDMTADSGTGTEIVSSDNEGNGEYAREEKVRRVEQQIYTVRREPLHSEIPDETEDLKVERGRILIKNKIDPSKDEDDFDDNLNLFDNEFHLQKDNPLYQSDPDLYKKFEEERVEEDVHQSEFRSRVNQDITFDTVDRIAHQHRSSSRNAQISTREVPKQNLSTLLLSQLANIDSKDIRQNIDVEHHNEEIYGDLDFVHADGSKSGSGNTDNFDAVNEKVNLTLREGKAFVIIKVIAERVVPIDYEFNVWRKSSAIVTRQIEIDLLANEQRRRLYEHVMENAGARGAIESGSYGPHSMTSSLVRNDNELSSMDTLRLFSQILSVTEGQGDNDATAYSTRQAQGRLSSSGAHDILY